MSGFVMLTVVGLANLKFSIGNNDRVSACIAQGWQRQGGGCEACGTDCCKLGQHGIGYGTVGGAHIAWNELRHRGTRKYCISNLPTLATKMMCSVPIIHKQRD